MQYMENVNIIIHFLTFVRLQEIHEAFVQEGQRTHRDRLLVSAAVGVGRGTIDAAYEMEQIHQ